MQDDQEFFSSFGGGASSAFHTSTTDVTGFTGLTDTNTTDTNDFVPPPKRSDLPHPWIARLSDDGREWFYVNQHTGETRRDRPREDAGVEEQMERLSFASQSPSQVRNRDSIELRQKAIDEWSAKTRRAINDTLSELVERKPPNMAWHMDVVNDALRGVFEAAVAGSASEEELSRAQDLNSEEGVLSALVREEAAVQMLRGSFTTLLGVLRTLFAAFGYVGPLDGMADMPRPKWAEDMTLLGSIGKLSQQIYAAVASRRGTQSIWADVLRAAMDLKDVLARFPELVTPNATPAAQDAVEGKKTKMSFGIEGAGIILSGRWGFGSAANRSSLRAVDSMAMSELQRAVDKFEAVVYAPDAVMDILRLANKYKNVSLGFDIAEIVDVDGDLSVSTSEEVAHTYDGLVVRVQNALLDLEEATAIIDDLQIVLLQSSAMDHETYRALSQAIHTSYEAISTLRHLSAWQKNMAAEVRGQIGVRAAKPSSPMRPQSYLSSSGSRRSVRSERRAADRPQVHGLEEEFVETQSRPMEDEHHEPLSPTINNSQTSLAGRSYRDQSNGRVSAGSSQASLVGMHASESEGGKTRRASIMKFMKGRGGDDDGEFCGMRGGTDRTLTTARASRRGTSRKLAKILGEDPRNISSAIPPPIITPTETPWYLREDFDPQELLWDHDGVSVYAATLEALVKKLTPHGSTDTTFSHTFMLTFKAFTTGPELLELLIKRYNIQPPDGLTPAELQNWKMAKETPIHLRVCNTIRTWLETHYLEQDVVCLDRIEEFAMTDVQGSGSAGLAKQLINSVNKRREHGADKGQRRIISGSLLSPPAPLVPRAPPPGRELKLSDINPLELARQLTIEDFDQYSLLPVDEMMKRAVDAKRNLHLSAESKDPFFPNVSTIIGHSNVVSSWAVRTILSSRDPKQRANIVKYFIQTAWEARQLNNFTAMANLLSAINSAPVARLKRTFEFLSQKYLDMKAAMDKILDSGKNFRNYKEMLRAINPPTVPFIGEWLSYPIPIPLLSPILQSPSLANNHSHQASGSLPSSSSKTAIPTFSAKASLSLLPGVKTV